MAGRDEDELESDDFVARLDVGDTLADRLYDAGTFMAEDDGKSTFRVLARECVCICCLCEVLPRMEFFFPYPCDRRQCNRFLCGLRAL